MQTNEEFVETLLRQKAPFVDVIVRDRWFGAMYDVCSVEFFSQLLNGQVVVVHSFGFVFCLDATMKRSISN